MAISILKREYDHHTEQVHAPGGSVIRDLMLGLNDGMVASFAVTSGLSGAFDSGNIVVMAGLAETLGGAVSMGLAAFISARSQIEFFNSEIERERIEIEKWPEREREEIRSIYRNKGFTGHLLDQIVSHIVADPDRWRKVMMSEELGFTGDFDSPLKSAAVVGSSYLIGAIIPVVPYFFLPPARGIFASALAAIGALFVVGAMKTVITSRSWWRSGLESMMTGVAAAAVTYSAGRWFAAR
jgi:VIT1/CCC1 family predicted Fe2+/Mn2+ transporter